MTLVLTTQATELAIVGGWHSDISTVVTVETHPQAKRCLEDNKLATNVDLHSTDGSDRWDHCRPVDLKNRQMFLDRGSTGYQRQSANTSAVTAV